MFGRKKKNKDEEEGLAGLPSISVSPVSATPPPTSPSPPAEGSLPPVTTTRTTVRIDGPATVFDARNVPGLRDEILDVINHGGNPGEIQDIVMKAVSEGHLVPGASPGPGGGVAPPPPPAEDPLDRLKKLNDLRVAGALTDAEFEAQKAKILGET